MNTIKSIGVTAFFMILLASNLSVFMEGLLCVFPPSNDYSFIGETSVQDPNSGMGTLAVAADKMNVFYIGVENPITVAASGLDHNNLSIKSEGAIITQQGNGHYTVTCQKPGQATITVTNKSTGQSQTANFRVKRIPDPVVVLANKMNGLIGSGEFKAQPGLVARLNNFDMDLRCAIQSYTLYYACKSCDVLEYKGIGGRFTGTIADVIKKAKPGDQYAFADIKVRCPGDIIGRKINGLAFQIK
ncbi:GldM family protein [Aureispira sp. CCB-QB1]|uniref:GldM family protein n=1 Tax=Aureispira sp. CCB-QB1 TaxID=1313421 RepID=UPI0006973AB2|nr:GldM family protein [Aureispira sp. CCB-QB1]